MITTRITSGYMVDAYTRKALAAQCGEMVLHRIDMASSGEYTTEQLAFMDHMISARVYDLLHLGAGAKLIALLRERKR